MKITSLIAAAGLTVAAFTAPAIAQTTTTVVSTAPTGPGWVEYRDTTTTYASDWDGPRYYTDEGPHHGWYSYNNDYYQHCSYRVTPHGHKRDWQCW